VKRKKEGREYCEEDNQIKSGTEGERREELYKLRDKQRCGATDWSKREKPGRGRSNRRKSATEDEEVIATSGEAMKIRNLTDLAGGIEAQRDKDEEKGNQKLGEGSRDKSNEGLRIKR